MGCSKSRVQALVRELKAGNRGNRGNRPHPDPVSEPASPLDGWDAVLDAARNGLPPEACAMAGGFAWPIFQRRLTEYFAHDPESDPPLDSETARMAGFFQAVAQGLNTRASHMADSVSGLNALQRAVKDWQAGLLLPDPAPENALKQWNAYLDLQLDKVGGTETQQQIVEQLRRFP